MRILSLIVFFILSIQGSLAQKPNIVFILADDLGWGDLQCYGNPYVETPALNKLAAEGLRFTDYYTPSPLCAPARAALLTGRYNHRTGAIDVSSNRGIDRIALSEKTMGDYFQHAGYTTALIGKWHNGLYNEAYLPYNRGFDLFYGFPNGGQDFYQWNLMRNGIYEKNDGRYMTDVLNEEAIKFIEAQKDKPFFLFLSHHAVHPPFQAPDSLVEKYVGRIGDRYTRDAAVMYAMIEIMDRGIWQIMKKLDELKLREKTLIVFTSDNGAFLASKKIPRFRGPFSGEKGNVLEQGIRVPAIVSWKGVIPQGEITSTPFHGCDWLPTLYSLTGGDPPEKAKPLDGINAMSLLKGIEMPELENRKLYFQKNRYAPVGHSDGSVRQGNWKLYWSGADGTMKKDIARDNPSYQRGLLQKHWEMPLDSELPSHEPMKDVSPKLFNLDEDPSERYDLAADHPALVKELSTSYDAWFESVVAEWRSSWAEIKEHDREYWKRRKTPNPRKLFDGYWHWKAAGLDSAAGNPLDFFKGYWSQGDKALTPSGIRKR
jgi:arylsulfatase A-like enzyme